MYIFNSTGCNQYHDNITDSKGCYVFDDFGNKYLDLEAGVWCLPLGHKHPRIVKCIKEQIDQIAHVNYRYNHEITEKAARKLIDITGIENGNCIFLSSGSEAVDTGIRISKCLLPNKKCLCLTNQYLSAYGYGANTETDDWIKVPWQYDEVKTESEWLEVLSSIDFEIVGVFVFEAGNSSGLVKLPPKNLVRLIAEKVHQVNGLIVVDEVTCGIGRTGKWFGYMHYELKPDIVAIGKGLGNGYPVSAIVFKDKIAEELRNINFRYAQSHQNDPLGCRVAYEVLKQIEQNDMLIKVNELGEYLRKSVSELLKEYTFIKEIRGIGLMNCIQFSDDVTPENMIKIEEYFFDKKIIVGINPVAKCLRIYTPFIIDTRIIDTFINELKCIHII